MDRCQIGMFFPVQQKDLGIESCLGNSKNTVSTWKPWADCLPVSGDRLINDRPENEVAGLTQNLFNQDELIEPPSRTNERKYNNSQLL